MLAWIAAVLFGVAAILAAILEHGETHWITVLLLAGLCLVALHLAAWASGYGWATVRRVSS